jgi:hypothetical protein
MSDSESGWYDVLEWVLTIGIAVQRKGFVWTNGTTVRRAPGSMKRPSEERPSGIARLCPCEPVSWEYPQPLSPRLAVQMDARLMDF